MFAVVHHFQKSFKLTKKVFQSRTTNYAKENILSRGYMQNPIFSKLPAFNLRKTVLD